jgi:hypothetical protein
MKSKLDQLAEQSMMMRGEILNDIIILEKTIDYFIVKHISESKKQQIEILELLLERISFHEKNNIVFTILKKHHSENLDIKPGNIFEDIGKVIRQRNYFAHYTVNVYNNAIDNFPNEVGFINFRDSTTVEVYDDKKYKKLREDIKKNITTIEKFL